MPKEKDTITVAKMKAEIAAHKAKKQRANYNPQVVNEQPVQLQPPGCDAYNSQVVHNTVRTPIDNLTDNCLKELNESLLKVLSDSFTDNELSTTLQKLKERCQAEGVAMPRDANLVEALLELHADSL